MDSQCLHPTPTEHFYHVLREARLAAVEHGHAAIRSTDLLFALVGNDESAVADILATLGVDRAALRNQTLGALSGPSAERIPSGQGPSDIPPGAIALTDAAETITKGAFALHKSRQLDVPIGVEHLLLASLEHPESEAGRLLAAHGLTFEIVVAEVDRSAGESA